MRVVSSGWSILSLTLSTLLIAVWLPAQAQQPTKIPRIAYLSGSDPKSAARGIEPFRQGLEDLGYSEGTNILIEYRHAEGKRDRFPTLASELVRLKPDVIIVNVLTAALAAKQATTSIPIVMVLPVDPVATGIVDSFARPGGNITGISRLTRELSGKRLELLTEIAPGISRIGVLWDGDDPGSRNIALKEYEAAARSLKIQLQSFELRAPDPDLQGAFEAVAKSRTSGLITIRSLLVNRYAKRIVNLATANRLPSMYEGTDYVEAGGLMSYSTSDSDQYRRAAVYVDKILKGAKPADLPIEQPTKMELAINLKTAKQMRLTIPPNVLARADRVIR